MPLKSNIPFTPYTEAKDQIVHYLQTTVDVMRHSVKSQKLKGYVGAAEVVLRHGRAFPPGPKTLPSEFQRGEAKQCFANSQRILLEHHYSGKSLLTYVEGYALSIIPIHHGWLVDDAGRVIDLTLRDPASAYVGVPIKSKYVLDMLRTTKHFVAMFDNWVHDPVQPIVSGDHPKRDWLLDPYCFGDSLC